ncbi:MAG: hypothetical protein JXX14_18580, partial [Deltaproteobacteria bacterium]|nr:hypothetical protein [Deltaproteobacteria bacterium]
MFKHSAVLLRYLTLVSVAVVILGYAGLTRAEGTYQVGANQDLIVEDFNMNGDRTGTTLKVYITEVGEVINIVAGNNNSGNDIWVTIVNPAGDTVVDRVQLTNNNGLIGGSGSLPDCPMTDGPFQYVTGDDAGDTAPGQYTISFEVEGT